MDDNKVRPYGYHTQSGYFGRLPNGQWMEFDTDGEYHGYLEEWGEVA